MGRLVVRNHLSAVFSLCAIVSGCRGQLGEKPRGDHVPSERLRQSPPPVSHRSSSPKRVVRKPVLRTRVTPGGYRVTVDVSRQVLELHLQPGFSETTGPRGQLAKLYPSPARIPLVTPFVSAGVLAAKAKQFDDGLLAAVELAAERGVGRLPSRRLLVRNLARRLISEVAASRTPSSGQLNAASFMAAGAQLGGVAVPFLPRVRARMRTLVRRFVAQPMRSKVLGFYTWNIQLQRIFRRDRFLQRELTLPQARHIARQLSRNPALSKAYERQLKLDSVVTNPGERPDLRGVARLSRRKTPPTSRKRPAVFPVARKVIPEILKELYPNSVPPPSFDLAQEIVRRLRKGKLSFKPRRDSGWYVHKLYALQALVRPEKTPEARHLNLSGSYRAELIALFRSLLLTTRETHGKTGGGFGLGGYPSNPPQVLGVDLSQDPLATYYLRRARSYRFIHQALKGLVGAGALGKIHRLTPKGPVKASLAQELRIMTGLFVGAYLLTCDQLGMTPAASTKLGTGRGPAHDRALFKRWASSVKNDPEVGRDIRMMLPLYYDPVRRRYKVWVLLGVAVKDLWVWYHRRPRVVAVVDKQGRTVPPSRWQVVFLRGGIQDWMIKEMRRKVRHRTPRDRLVLLFRGNTHHYPVLVSAEVSVRHLMSRAAFRRHCDRYKTRRAILRHLR